MVKQKLTLYDYTELLVFTACSFLVLLILDLVVGYEDSIGFGLLHEHFYTKPFNDCRVITDHTYKDIHYGGYVSWLKLFGLKAFYSWITLAFAFPLYYIIGIRFLNKYCTKLKTSEDDYDKYDTSPVKWNIFGLIYLILVVWLYDLIVYYISNLYFGEIYNCLDIIQYVQESHEFKN